MIGSKAGTFLLAAALCASFGIPAARAADELVVATFGGSFADATQACHIKAFEKETGAKVITTLGSSVDIAAKIRATAGSPDIDVAYMDISIAKQIKAEGLLETLDFKSLSDYAEVAPQAFDKDGQFVNFMTAATVIAYNPEKVKTPPTSWNDLFDPKYAGKIALGDITGTSGLHFLLAVNKMKGGDFASEDAGFAAIKALMPNVVMLYTQADQLVELFERGDIVMAPWYPDRAGSAADKGVPVAVAYPKEGGVGIQPTVSVPKGAPNKALAMKYIEVLLSKEGQKCFAESKYAGPVNTKVELSEKVSKIVPFGESYEKLWYPDTDAIAKLRPGWTERWQKEVAR
ncbi:putative spermidine/putrescine transport system substrate-binding protein [Tistlia consotensis]|uniref:Putative spermidine/putrescine transport system substrate-binding protein n=1 Tax=Tistlia consotensis USBA 355 TaxID=560819 RepID=A0A1Y6BWX9_9PROT|nr:ABC transporter substrate-binding protein [Tistlia consotensis]SMF32135.1 putative spermidine/putrescine transport system substrate-binding protein [Tistlia consotensis USBA 355]SNR68186.1 putative spermidine/putrescine transport system substrate-binding protein [Tistlia consotensis]